MINDIRKKITTEPKVFGIGFHKTGTSSLAAALRLLGHRVTGPDRVWSISSYEEITDVIDSRLQYYDAFQDNPYPMAYKYIDRTVSDCRFILTVRDEKEWIQSIVNHFGGNSSSMREYIYGAGKGDPIGNEELYLEKYKNHNKKVKRYFSDRDDFLVMNITDGDGWTKICNFLNLPTPHPLSFPHTNSRRINRKNRLFQIPKMPLRGIYFFFRWMKSIF